MIRGTEGDEWTEDENIPGVWNRQKDDSKIDVGEDKAICVREVRGDYLEIETEVAVLDADKYSSVCIPMALVREIAKESV